MKSKITLLLCALLVWGCKKTASSDGQIDLEESSQQIGDTLASIDESGTAAGSIAFMDNSIKRTFDHYAPGTYQQNKVADIFLPKAYAASCAGAGFAACNGTGQVVRTFAGCTVGAATFNGTVTLQWSNGVGCSMGGTGQFISRDPNFTVTGLRGATLSVSKAGANGQRITWISGAGAFRTLSFSNDGINRVFTFNSSTLLDQTTSTTSAITITGTDRTSRVMSGGGLRVADNLSGVSCTYVPSAVTWSSGACNCPTSGSWTGTCSNGKTSTLTHSATCGAATYTDGASTLNLNFDRCGS